MNPDTIKELLLLLKTELLSAFKDLIIDAVFDSEMPALYADQFVLSYKEDERLFSITFFVGTTNQRACQITYYLMEILGNVPLVILEDSFWDAKTQKIFFGDDAIHAKYREYLEARGKKACDICGEVTPIEDDTKIGCYNCSDYLNTVLWN